VSQLTPTDPPAAGLDRDDLLQRYARQILLPEIDIEGQEALAQASVLLVGMGGLGCPAALYLAAAGVGELVLADGDRVELSNLQRQVLFNEGDIGRLKVEAAAQALARSNPHVQLRTLPERLAGERLAAAVGAATVVLDGSDNFATRHAVNRACVEADRPLVSAAAVRFEAQFAVFDPTDPQGPCYACLYPEAEPGEADEAPAERCEQAGVVGPLVGMMGSLQALAAIRLVTGAGGKMSGNLLLFDALSLEWQRLRLPRDPQCPVCARRTWGIGGRRPG
jgi:molybdopterin-synthase adenylyltransferase